MEPQLELKDFLDKEGKLTLFPAKRRKKILSLMYIASKFEQGIIYSEKEVNAIIEAHHTFQNKWLLRRELIDKGFLDRKNDGSKYWVTEIQPKLERFGLDE
ncbi:DUF2087 domain-containing protein [Mobilitalea sibirica]|uniref:DUF2087 domain-containing protein n=1 Tax=Mobilitalea sibirica TaxID=1462919 RepID=A0A8J7H2N4_9FIRM|nr:DUF2087 domain-containing protein [Mobilitalea sibirica]MBH1940830.1 DUF2087 domain-containing protein [Mobilitalea sibirica]